ncbi:MAG TPA: molybdopterin biosynthesis protein [Aliiroseovarius sp.]|nr:molybdopterin biosynthesis protein [Aliiroseovarius sp.]
MRFGPVQVDKAAGAVLAHSVAVPGGRLRKGMVLGPAEVAALQAAGHAQVVVARLDPGDMGEDAAAQALGEALLGPGLRLVPATGGRVNLFAAGPGLLAVDRDRVEALNLVDPMITLATLKEWTQVAQGDLIATVKIIAYGVEKTSLSRACAAADGALALRRPVLEHVDLVQTGAPGKLVEKGRRALAVRLQRFGVELAGHAVVAHEVAALAEAIGRATAPMVCIFTASATSDMRDVGPEALHRAGGRVVHFGMPVDPGNLLFLGEIAGRKVIGLPGCARSLAKNGADLVLGRMLCGVEVGPGDIAAMGVGGLLKEMPSRPQPRER